MIAERGRNWEMWLGDCREVLLPGVDCVITDPPWPNMPEGLYEGPESLPDVFPVLSAIARRIVVHLGRASDPRCLASIRLPFVCVCWLRYAVPSYCGTILNAADVAYVFGDHRAPKGSTVIPGEVTSSSSAGNESLGEHPTPRKLEHALWLAKWFTNDGESVLDPYAGSGTTGVACLRLGRRFHGVEKDPRYFALACDRLRAEEHGTTLEAARRGQEALFR